MKKLKEMKGKPNYLLLILYLQGILGYLIKVMYFNVLFRNYGNL